MSAAALSARQLTRRLVARGGAQSYTPDGSVGAAQAAVERTYHELARILGPTGSRALLTRALAQAQTEHPILEEIRIGGHAAPALEDVTALARAHGGPAVAAGLEALLESVIGLLGRLIGPDVVARLVERGAPTGPHHHEDVQ